MTYNIWKLVLFVAAFLIELTNAECPGGFSYFMCFLYPNNYPIYHTKDGPVGGSCKYSNVAGVEICSTLGIPFAAPPVNELRFMPPQPPQKWTSTLWAFNFGNTCFEVVNPIVGSEDCLFLNVFVPREQCNTTSPCSVMIWIQGGGFFSGSANIYGPEHFLARGIIVVTFNYRLGVFGFSSTEDGNIPGNAGLLDQQAVFKWVQQNIEVFGGDKNSVTIFGYSAGAASVCFHCLSPTSEGLFQKVIMESGSCLSDWAIQRNPRQILEEFATSMGITYTDTFDLTAKLKRVSAFLLNLNCVAFMLNRMTLQDALVITPHVDYGSPAFLEDIPQNIINGYLAKNQSLCHGAKIITGITKDEGGIAKPIKKLFPLKFPNSRNDVGLVVPQKCNLHPDSTEFNAIGNKIFDRYQLNSDENLYTFITSMHFVDGQFNFIKAVIDSGEEVFVYNLDYCGPETYVRNTFFPSNKCEEIGPIHLDGTSMQFHMPHVIMVPAIESPAGLKFIKEFVGALTTFAKTGNPTDPSLGLDWKPTTNKSDLKILHFDKILTMGPPIYLEEIDFWENVCNPN